MKMDDKVIRIFFRGTAFEKMQMARMRNIWDLHWEMAYVFRGNKDDEIDLTDSDSVSIEKSPLQILEDLRKKLWNTSLDLRPEHLQFLWLHYILNFYPNLQTSMQHHAVDYEKETGRRLGKNINSENLHFVSSRIIFECKEPPTEINLFRRFPILEESQLREISIILLQASEKIRQFKKEVLSTLDNGLVASF